MTITLQDDAVLFTLSFRALRRGDALASVLRPGSEITAAQSYDHEGRSMSIDFEFVKPTGDESAVFALYHIVGGDPSLVGLWYVLPLFVVGIIFGFAAHRTGRLATSQVAHASMNLLAFVALLASL